MGDEKRRGKAFSLYLDEAVQAAAMRMAEREGTSLSAMVEGMLSERVGVRANERRKEDRAHEAETKATLMGELGALLGDASGKGASHVYFELSDQEVRVTARLEGEGVHPFGLLDGRYGKMLLDAAFQAADSPAYASWRHWSVKAHLVSGNEHLGLPPVLHGVRLLSSRAGSGTLVTMTLLRKETAPSAESMGMGKEVELRLKEAALMGHGMVLLGAEERDSASRVASALLQDVLRERHDPAPAIAVVSSFPRWEISGARHFRVPYSNKMDDLGEQDEAARCVLECALDSEAEVVLFDGVPGPQTIRTAAAAALSGRRVWVPMQATCIRSMPLRLRDMGVDDRHIREAGFLQAVAWVGAHQPGETMGRMLPAVHVRGILRTDNEA